jgi:hypothetical protein
MRERNRENPGERQNDILNGTIGWTLTLKLARKRYVGEIGARK